MSKVKIFVKNGWHFHHKNVQGLKQIMNYVGAEQVNSIEEADVIYSSSEPCPESGLYPNKTFIYGPQFGIYLNDNQKYKQIDNRNQNCFYIQPSQWAADVWIEDLKEGKQHVPIIPCPFPVEVDRFKPDPSVPKNLVFIYFKRRKYDEINLVYTELVQRGYQPIVFDYMRGYPEEQYIQGLKQAKFGVWVGSHESQGFALLEVLSSNVPLLVWSATSMTQEEGSWMLKKTKTKTISNSYFDERCGETFFDKEEFVPTLNQFIGSLSSYSPREYILENMDVKHVYEKFWKRFFEKYI